MQNSRLIAVLHVSVTSELGENYQKRNSDSFGAQPGRMLQFKSGHPVLSLKEFLLLLILIQCQKQSLYIATASMEYFH